MVRRIMGAVLCVLLLLPALALAGAPVVDQCELFTADEINEMEELIAQIRVDYQMDAVVLTSSTVPKNASYESLANSQDYADEYFDQNGYGLGEDQAGILYLIDMKNRVSLLSTRGVMIDYITDKRREAILDAAGTHLAAGHYGAAAIAVLRKVQDFLRQGIEDGSFRYDLLTGERLTGLYNSLTRGEMILGGVAGLAAALILYFSVAAKYQLRRSTYRFSKDTQSERTLTKDEQTFLRQTVHRVPISSGGGRGGRGGGGRSGGSGVHISSGGGVHGGGGRHF